MMSNLLKEIAMTLKTLLVIALVAMIGNTNALAAAPKADAKCDDDAVAKQLTALTTMVEIEADYCKSKDEIISTFTKLGCNATVAAKHYLTACPAPKAEPATDPVDDFKVAPLTPVAKAPETEPEAKVSDVDFSMCPDRSNDWFISAYPVEQIADYVAKAPDRLADKQVANPGGKVPPTAWRKAGITQKQEADINKEVLNNLPIGFDAATNNVRRYLPREMLDAKMVEAMQRLGTLGEDKTWNLSGANLRMIEMARTFYGSLSSSQKSPDIDELYKRIADEKALKSLERDSKRFKADLAMSHVAISCAIVQLAPNAPREFALAGKEYQGRKQISPDQAKRGQMVYILRADGSVHGPVEEELTNGTLKVSTSKDNPHALMEDDVKNGKAKLYADAYCADCGNTSANGGNTSGGNTGSPSTPSVWTSILPRGSGSLLKNLTLNLGVSAETLFSNQSAVRSGKLFGQYTKGYEVVGTLTVKGAWVLNNTLALTYGVGAFAGFRETLFRDETQIGFSVQKGFTVGARAELGLDIGRWVEAYALAKGRFYPGGVEGGGGLRVTGVPYADFGVEYTYGVVNNNATTVPGAEPMKFMGNSIGVVVSGRF
jgi:hypothetical protein